MIHSRLCTMMTSSTYCNVKFMVEVNLADLTNLTDLTNRTRLDLEDARWGSGGGAVQALLALWRCRVRKRGSCGRGWGGTKRRNDNVAETSGHGRWKKRSCLTGLLLYLNHWNLNLTWVSVFHEIYLNIPRSWNTTLFEHSLTITWAFCDIYLSILRQLLEHFVTFYLSILRHLLEHSLTVTWAFSDIYWSILCQLLEDSVTFYLSILRHWLKHSLMVTWGFPM